MPARFVFLAVLAAWSSACSGGVVAPRTGQDVTVEVGERAKADACREGDGPDAAPGVAPRAAVASEDGADPPTARGTAVEPAGAPACPVAGVTARPVTRAGDLLAFSDCAQAPCDVAWARIDALAPAFGAPPTWILLGGTHEHGEFQADCGGWAECQTAVALPCGDSHVALVLPFDYRWQFKTAAVEGGMWAFDEAHRTDSIAVELAPGGPPAPYVTRWTWRGGTYTSHEPQDACKPSVTEVLFIPDGDEVSVTILGGGFCTGASAPTASFGALSLEGVIVRASGRELSGLLRRMPDSGARLRVHTPPGEPVDTGYVVP